MKPPSQEIIENIRTIIISDCKMNGCPTINISSIHNFSRPSYGSSFKNFSREELVAQRTDFYIILNHGLPIEQKKLNTAYYIDIMLTKTGYEYFKNDFKQNLKLEIFTAFDANTIKTFDVMRKRFKEQIDYHDLCSISIEESLKYYE